MATQNLLYQRQCAINNSISVVIPKVGEILDNEDAYYHLVSAFTAMPIDLMVLLDDNGIDYTTINEYDLFLLLFPGIQSEDTRLLLGDLDLTKFKPAISDKNGKIILRDSQNGIVIDRLIHNQIANTLRKIHHLEKNRRKPANQEAKDYLMQREREKLKRRRNRVEDSQLESIIVAMVNAEPYKYDFEGTRELSIYQFNESVRQVIKKTDYNNKMHGIYAGTIKIKDLSQDELNWLTHK